MKRLFVCCDGTWNSDSDEFQGVPVPTNVVRFFNAVSDINADGGEQLKYYHAGVGANESRLRRLIDGALGVGLSRDIRTAYKWLSDHREADSEIYIAGFSRGAFTARSLVGMLHHCGLPHAADWSLVRQAWALYRLDPKIEENAQRQANFRAMHGAPPRIRFLGVWETVGALGIPEALNPFGFLKNQYQFHDTTLSPEVERAVQALAIDEQRNNFFPTLWTPEDGADDARVSQVWFPGVHADVGGGYKETELSNATLQWMLSEAQLCGATFRPQMLGQLPKADQVLSAAVHGVLHNSLTSFYRRVGFRPRSFPCLKQDSRRGSESISTLTLARQADPPIAQAPYRPHVDPVNDLEVRVFANPLWNWTGIFMQEGVGYKFQVMEGQSWLDWRHACGAEGTTGNFVQRLLTRFKRVSDANWFELCGAVTYAAQPTIGGTPPEPHFFRIGMGTTITAPTSGYLYCFANDARWAYSKNQGSIRVKICALNEGPCREKAEGTGSDADVTTPPASPSGTGSSQP
jgi:hypothetical protein